MRNFKFNLIASKKYSKVLLLSILSVVFIIILTLSLESNSSGIIGQTGTNSNKGCTCHSNSIDPATILSISSSTGSFRVAPGGTLDLTLDVSNNSEVAAGCDISVKTTIDGETNIGTLAPGNNSGLKLLGKELTHSSPKNLISGSTSFNFTWTAPTETGTYYLRATANCVNLDKTQDGDAWNKMTPVSIIVALDTPKISISPNPIIFTSTPVGQSAIKTISILNTGTIDANITNILIGGMDQSMFMFVGSLPSFPAKIIPGANISFELKFNCSNTNEVNANLNISIQDISNNIIVPIQASGFVSDVSEENTNSIFKIFPNPISNNINLEFYSDETQECELVLSDISGVKINQIKLLSNSGRNNFSWNIYEITNNKLNSGIYFLTLKTKSSSQLQKIIIFE